MTDNTLLRKIEEKSARIAVIGLGYVGLPLALLFAEKGFKVTGFVRSEKKKNELNKGISHLDQKNINEDLKKFLKNGNLSVEITEGQDLEKNDVVVICVPTPVDNDKTPDLTDLLEVAKLLSRINLEQKLIINESTVAPFTTREVLGNLPGNYFLVCSPERIDPGNNTKNTENIPKVIGGINPQSLELGVALYKKILKNETIAVKSMEAAEMAKMLENTYRATNIAVINEFAKLADACGIDILDVIAAASSKWSFHAHFPGIGVGGHCIPVDPYYILKLAKSKNLDMKVVEESLKENEKMPKYVLENLVKHYKKGMSVVVYGITYKKNINDLRESPVIEFCHLLEEQNIPFKVFDPYVSDEKLSKMGFETASGESDIFVVGTDHDELAKDYKEFVNAKTLVIDGRNFFDKKIGSKVIGIGRVLQ